jgi:hypothetical protein
MSWSTATRKIVVVKEMEGAVEVSEGRRVWTTRAATGRAREERTGPKGGSGVSADVSKGGSLGAVSVTGHHSGQIRPRKYVEEYGIE